MIVMICIYLIIYIYDIYAINRRLEGKRHVFLGYGVHTASLVFHDLCFSELPKALVLAGHCEQGRKVLQELRELPDVGHHAMAWATAARALG